jgi:HAD superfamily phosphatase (TIGR01668 family)
MSDFRPDFRFHTIYEVTPAFLAKEDIKGLILDIDNTLVYYGVHKPTPENSFWIKAMQGAGIKLAFVSNGHEERVRAYNESFGFHCSFKSRKPRRGGFLEAAKTMGIAPTKIAAVGDQLFTDVLGGNRAGMITVLVDPIRPEPWLPFKIKRMAERPVLKKCRYTEVDK